jgi:hypothetical protein
LFFVAAAPPSKGHTVVNPKHKPTKDVPKHPDTSKPAWLLALEVVTGTMVCSLVLVAVVTALQKCKSKPSMIIPWKKSASEKDHTTVFIGLFLTASASVQLKLLNCIAKQQWLISLANIYRFRDA